MVRIIFLLAPIFVSLFWSITLNSGPKKCSTPRRFLSWFMLLTGVIFTAHFLYFAPLPNLYRFVDVPLQWLSLSIFPLYYIYFRLLTVDDHFSLKTHSKYLIIPALVALIYGLGVLFTPADEYKAWLFNQPYPQASAAGKYLSFMRNVMQIGYIITLVVSLAGNYLLIHKFGHKAEQFYSDLRDAKLTNVKQLIYSILAMGILSGVITLIGRTFIMQANGLVYSAWTLFAVLLFMMGNSGIRQKLINPSVDPANIEEGSVLPFEISGKEQEEFMNKIIAVFVNHKIYLNSNLNIADVVKIVGTNRGYVSLIINQHSNQNFCSFVNDFRLEELKRLIPEKPDATTEDFSHRSGFGSVNSLKRAISARTGMSFKDFKQQVRHNHQH